MRVFLQKDMHDHHVATCTKPHSRGYQKVFYQCLKLSSYLVPNKTMMARSSIASFDPYVKTEHKGKLLCQQNNSSLVTSGRREEYLLTVSFRVRNKQPFSGETYLQKQSITTNIAVVGSKLEVAIYVLLFVKPSGSG